jgi:pyridinium-3,5-biscarboxylic acid mononucleotide synthase
VQEAALRELLDGVRTGAVAPDEALRRLRRLPFTDLGFARVDHHRALRQGMAEAVYAPGKTPEECAAIVTALRADGGAGPVVLTRAEPDQAAAALAAQPDGVTHPGQPTTVVWDVAAERDERVVVVTAGTSDGPVAAECVAVLAAHGLAATELADVGVSGVHRLLASMDDLADAHAVVVVAGMEGALPSVVAGLTSAPVVAVPTSVGYGASLEGVTALLAMLASCAPGIAVVGIDNGYGAACAIVRLLGARTA